MHSVDKKSCSLRRLLTIRTGRPLAAAGHHLQHAIYEGHRRAAAMSLNSPPGGISHADYGARAAYRVPARRGRMYASMSEKLYHYNSENSIFTCSPLRRFQSFQ